MLKMGKRKSKMAALIVLSYYRHGSVEKYS